MSTESNLSESYAKLLEEIENLKFNNSSQQVINDKLSERHMTSMGGRGPLPIVDHFSKNSRDI